MANGEATTSEIFAAVKKQAMSKFDLQFWTLVEILKEKNILGDADLRRILSMEPFPRSV